MSVLMGHSRRPEGCGVVSRRGLSLRFPSTDGGAEHPALCSWATCAPFGATSVRVLGPFWKLEFLRCVVVIADL